MKILVTGLAGFIGFHTARHLAGRGHTVIGIDNFQSPSPIDLQRHRLRALPADIAFHEMDVTDQPALSALAAREAPDIIIHLAGQPGVRQSGDAPMLCGKANLMGHLSVLEACRSVPNLSHLIYASSSSVYGEAEDTPLDEAADTGAQISLYAATKRASELMSSVHAHLYGLKQVGLRFFTVYGPYGRPDMAYWLFAEKILRGEPIPLFDGGELHRDMTHISDVVTALAAIVECPPAFKTPARPHEIFNIGTGCSEPLNRIVDILENALHRKAKRIHTPRPAMDMVKTWADASSFKRVYGFAPDIRIDKGLPEFADWLSSYRTD